jgi:tetratricopeptide (TPR) repeat protein
MEDLDRAIRINPNYADAYNQRSVVYANFGDAKKSLADLNQAIRLNPNYADAYYNRGKTSTP